MMNWVERGRRRSWPNFKVLSRHFPGGTELNHEEHLQNRRSPGRDFNTGPPEYEAGVFTTGIQRSVMDAVIASETSVSLYQSTLRIIHADRHLHICNNVISYVNGESLVNEMAESPGFNSRPCPRP
jgi:hypothetical protein